jgi:repressor LexA
MTEKQNNILNFIKKFTFAEGHPPKYIEISEHFGIGIPTVQNHIEALIKKNCLEKTSGMTRGFRVKESTFDEFSKAKSSSRLIPILGTIINEYPKTKPDIDLIPVLGTVAAGTPIWAHERVEGFVSYNTRSSQKMFAVKVMGDSMIEVGICDCDVLIVKHQKNADNGDIIVALCEDNTVTVKTLRNKNSQTYLEPANKKYSSMKGIEFEVLGKVVGLVRESI